MNFKTKFLNLSKINAFCMIIEFKFVKNRKTIIPKDT